MFTPDGQEWTRRALDTVPAEGTVHHRSLDAEHRETNGEVLISAQDPITPKVLLFDLNAAAPLGAPVILKGNPENFDPSGLVVTRHEAVSTDGEMIPYTQVGPANGNGGAPVHLTAYGGTMVAATSVKRLTAVHLHIVGNAEAPDPNIIMRHSTSERTMTPAVAMRDPN
ncbi:hypothetical protein [Mesorhizobium sp. M0870]|uniref:hypothetical protein n=1 Tax=Mesorhizobium sp. M0870 TaxID=2957016 RepID=UPI00333C276E